MLQNSSRSIRPVAILLVAGGVAACTGAPANSASDDFTRDLQLASTAVDLAGPGVDSALLGQLETQPNAAPEQAVRVVRGSGERAVSSRTPTVRATPTMEVAAVERRLRRVCTVASDAVRSASARAMNSGRRHDGLPSDGSGVTGRHAQSRCKIPTNPAIACKT